MQTLTPRQKIILAFALPGLLAAGVVALFLHTRLMDAAIDRWGADNQYLIHTLKNTVTQQTQTNIRILQATANQPAFSALPFLDRIDPAINGIPQELEADKRQILETLRRDLGSFSVLFVLSPKGDHYISHPYKVQEKLKRFNLADRPYFIEATQTQKPVVSDSFVGAEGIPVVVIDVPILNEEQNLIAHLGGAFHLRKLSTLMDAKIISPFSAGFIVDRKGQLIAHTDTTLLENRATFADHPLVKSQASRQARVLQRFVDPQDGTRNLASSVLLENGWRLVLLRPESSIHKAVRPQVIAISLLVLAMLIGIGSLGTLLAARISKKWEKAEERLQEAHHALEERVVERTQKLKESEQQSRGLFNNTEVSIWNEDFSEVQTALHQLRAQGIEDLHRHLTENNEIAWALAKRIKVLHVNDATLKLFEAKDEAEILQQIEKTFGSNIIDTLIDELCALWNGDRVFRSETTFCSLQGRPIDAIISFQIPETDEGFASIPVSIVDITHLKRVEEDLRRNEENLRITLNSIGDAVIATNTEGIIATMNPVAERLTGWSAADGVGCPLAEVFHIIHARTRKPADNPVERVLATGDIVGLANHTALLSKDGREYQIADSGAPIRNEQSEIVGVVLVFRDITEEYALQEQLQHSRKMEAVGQLAGGVAHDFNNMLGGILGAAELLETCLPEAPKAKRLHALIIDSAERAADLTDKLLAFARKQPMASTAIDLHRIIIDTVALLKSTIDRRIEVTVNLTAQDSQVLGAPSQLQSALLNLGLNASHAMPDGGTIHIVSREIELDPSDCNASLFAITPGPYVEIEIRDSGSGILPDVMPHIFEPFFTTKEQGQGTGLGLAAVLGTVQQHGGAITVQSEAETGTTFCIWLPRAEREVSKYATPRQPIRGSGRILVVDDEPTMRTTAQAILQDLGYEVLLAEDGQQGLGLFEELAASIDLVLLDMKMPRMNGRDCFYAIHAIQPKTPVILASGFSPADDLDEMKTNGLRGYIQKPFRTSALSQVIHQALNPTTGSAQA